MTESGVDEKDGVLLHSVWRRKDPGREVVRIDRIWEWNGCWAVRAHPVRGGKPLICPTDYMKDHYDLVAQ